MKDVITIYRRGVAEPSKVKPRSGLKKYGTLALFVPLLILGWPYILGNKLIGQLKKYEDRIARMRPPLRRLGRFLASGDIKTKRHIYDLFYDSGRFKNNTYEVNDIRRAAGSFIERLYETLPSEYTKLEDAQKIKSDLKELFDKDDFIHIDNKLVSIDTNAQTRYRMLYYSPLDKRHMGIRPKQKMAKFYKGESKDAFRFTIPTFVEEETEKEIEGKMERVVEPKVVLGTYELNLDFADDIGSLGEVVGHETGHIFNLFDMLYRSKRVSEFEKKDIYDIMIDALYAKEDTLLKLMSSSESLLENGLTEEQKGFLFRQLQNGADKFVLSRQVKYFSWKTSGKSLSGKNLSQVFDIRAMKDLEKGTEAVADYMQLSTYTDDVTEHAMMRSLMMSGNPAARAKIIKRFESNPKMLREILFSAPSYSEIVANASCLEKTDFEKRYRRKYALYLAERIAPLMLFMPLAINYSKDFLINALALRYLSLDNVNPFSKDFGREFGMAQLKAQIDLWMLEYEHPGLEALIDGTITTNSGIAGYALIPAVFLGIDNKIRKIVRKYREKKEASDYLKSELDKLSLEIEMPKGKKAIAHALEYLFKSMEEGVTPNKEELKLAVQNRTSEFYGLGEGNKTPLQHIMSFYVKSMKEGKLQTGYLERLKKYW